MSIMYSKVRPRIVIPAIKTRMSTRARLARIVRLAILRRVGVMQPLITTFRPSNWKAHMPRCVANSAIKMLSSKVRLQPVFHVMPTQHGTPEHWARNVPHAIILPIGIRQASICRIRNPEPKMAEAVSITAGLVAVNAIHPLYNRTRVPPVMRVILVVTIREEKRAGCFLIKIDPCQGCDFM